MAKLFTPYTLKNLTLKNRIMMAPMCMYSAQNDGLVTDWHKVHYTTRAVGGVGLIVLEATGVEPRGRISEKDLGIWDDAHIAGLKEIVDAVHANDAKVGIQLAHAGRKSDTSGDPIIAPSALLYSDAYREPVEMTLEDIKTVISAFVEAAKRAEKAGFDIIEIHAAHGYLINTFLSPLTNKRTDAYGGNLKKRARILKEILEAVREVWPKEKPICVRVSGEDYQEAGNHPEDLGQILKYLKESGVAIDIVNVSSGGVISIRPKTFPGYQVKMAETISTISGLPVIAGGLITEPEHAEEIVQNDRAEMVFFARELLRNPYWPLHAAKVLDEDLEWPRQYKMGK